MAHRSLFVLIAVLLVPGCSDPVGVRPITIERTYPAAGKRIVAMDSYDRFGASRPEPAAASSSGLAWDKPEGWQELPPVQYKEANFRIGDAACYLTLLPSSPLLDNINRWCGQLGLAAFDQAAVDALPKISLLQHEGVLIDLTGSFQGKTDQRLLGVIADLGGRALATLKMTGPADVVAREAERFRALAASFRVAEEPATEPVAPGLAWDAPSTWQAGRSGDMRLATFHPDGSHEVECVVFHFVRPAGGDELGNVQRWYGQMGEKLPADGLAGLPEIAALGGTWRLVKLRGTFSGGMGAAAGSQDTAMFALYTEVPGHVYCIKMTGPANAVLAEEERFVAFCKSLRTS